MYTSSSEVGEGVVSGREKWGMDVNMEFLRVRRTSSQRMYSPGELRGVAGRGSPPC